MANLDPALKSFLFRGFGWVALAIAAFLLIANTAFWLRADKAAGTVVRISSVDQITASRGGAHISEELRPVIAFETQRGEQVEFEANVGVFGSSESYPVGDAVTVLYQPETPQEARIRALTAMYLGPLALLALAGGSLYLGEWLR